MSKVYDITSKISTEKPIIKMGDKEYAVDNSKNTMLLVSQELSNSDNQLKGMDKAVELLLGEDAFKEIENMKLSIDATRTLFIALMASVNGEEYEKAEARFQKSKP